MNRPLKKFDLGSSTAISSGWFGEIGQAPTNQQQMQMLIPDMSVTRATQDMTALAVERGIAVLDLSKTKLSGGDEAALSFIQPKMERRLHVVTRNLGRGVVIVDD